jgi:hypothetical protein
MKDFSLEHELNLVRNIMATIEIFNQDHGITSSPGVIRDNLLVAASLLHREAVRLEEPEAEANELQDSFSEVAKVCFERALEVSAHVVNGIPQ